MSFWMAFCAFTEVGLKEQHGSLNRDSGGSWLESKNLTRDGGESMWMSRAEKLLFRSELMGEEIFPHVLTGIATFSSARLCT